MYKLVATLMLFFVVKLLFGQIPFRCGQEQLHKRLMKEIPSYKEKQEKQEVFYLKVMSNSDKVEDKSPVATHTIPVVFHVMHNPNDAVGQGSNVSLSRLQTEVANWNLAFDNIGPYAGGPNHCNAGVSSSDVDVNFCLATQDPLGFPTDGVERYSFDGGNPLYKDDPSPNTGQLDVDMKELSNWDSKKYLNVWVVDRICNTINDLNSCGVVGYATLPGASGFIQDGVVVEDAFIGTNSDNSKVMVHELGHYLNLLHTFQQGCSTGSCLTSGDRVCDTPLDNTTSPTFCGDNQTANSCTNDASIPNSPFATDVQDMYENYMDYGELSCANTFTPNQATRMEAVVMSGGNREELNSSAGCSSPTVSNTQVAFSTNQLSVSEAAANTDDGCQSYSTVRLKVKISKLPTSNVTLDFSTSGTATSGRDYDLVTSSVTFNTTGALHKHFEIRIYDDALVEGLETITLSYNISGPAVAASANQSLTLNLKDDDVIPGQVFFEEDFESGTNGWSSTGFGAFPLNPFVIGTNSGLTNNAAYVSTNTTSKPFEYDNTQSDNPLLVSPQINGSAMQGATLTFSYQANGSGDDFGRLAYRTAANGFFVPFGPQFTNQGNSVNTASVPIPSQLNGELFELGFSWVNNGNGSGQNPPFAVDNIKISSQAQAVATSLNTLSEEYLGPNESIFFYSDDDKIIAHINNTSSHDYGCITLTIDRSGTGATNGTGDYSSNEFLDKTIIVTTTNNNAAGSYEIALYYTEAEIAGWEAATGLSRGDLSMIKSTGPISSAQSSNSEVVSFSQNGYGSDWAYAAQFNSGFSGFGFSKINLPLQLLSFDASYVGERVKLEWLTTNEILMDKIIVEKSRDGRIFEEFEHVFPIGMIRNEYQLMDENPFKRQNYYRLKFVDLDGSFSYSKIILLKKEEKFDIVVYPNPISKNVIQLQLYSESSQDLSYSIYNVEGVLILKDVVSNVDQFGRLEIPFINQGVGLYYIKVIQGDQIKVVRFFNN